MKKSLISLLFGFTLLFGTQNVQAMGLFIEPFAGYGMGSGDVSVSFLGASANSSGTYSGIGYGGRAGLTVPGGLYFGGQYSKMDMHFEQDLANSTTATSAVEWVNLGGVVGYRTMAVPFRIWAGYYFSAEANSSFDGSGFLGGLGYSIVPYVSLNFEVRSLSGDNAVSIAGLTATSELDAFLVHATISIPAFF